MKKILISFLFSFFGIEMASIAKPTSDDFKYVDQAISIIKEHHLKASQIDWELLRKKSYADLEKLNRNVIVESLLLQLNDQHSRFSLSGNRHIARKPTTIDLPHASLLTPKVAIIKIPSFSSSSLEEWKIFASIGQAQICKLGDLGIEHWVVDLRDNFGGEIWPMLLAVAPLLSRGTIGGFFRNGKFDPWENSGNRVAASNSQDSLGIATHCQTAKQKKVVILIDQKTASAAEAVAIAFRHQENTRVLGSRTKGFASAIQTFELNGGGKLQLSVAWFADRQKQIYESGVDPDLKIDPQEIISKTLDWLTN